MTGEEAHSEDCRRCQMERWAREQRETAELLPYMLEWFDRILGLPDEGEEGR